MLHLHDRATMADALTTDLNPSLRRLLAARIQALKTLDYDLTDSTEILVIEHGDTEEQIVEHIGFSPFTNPIDGMRFNEEGFHPFWDWTADHDGWLEMIITFGSTFAYIILIADGYLDTLK